MRSVKLKAVVECGYLVRRYIKGLARRNAEGWRTSREIIKTLTPRELCHKGETARCRHNFIAAIRLRLIRVRLLGPILEYLAGEPPRWPSRAPLESLLGLMEYLLERLGVYF